MEYKPCHLAAVDLLHRLNLPDGDSVSIVRDIIDAPARCDDLHGLASVGDATAKQFYRGDDECRARLASGKLPTDDDRYCADYVLLKNREWYVRELSATLSWGSWAQYQLAETPADVRWRLATAGIVGAATGFLGCMGGLGPRASVVASAATSSLLAASRWRKLDEGAP